MIRSHLSGQRVSQEPRHPTQGATTAAREEPGPGPAQVGPPSPGPHLPPLCPAHPPALTPACGRGTQAQSQGVPGRVNRWSVLTSSIPVPFDSASCLPAQASPLPVPHCSMCDICWLNSVSGETELWWGRDATIHSVSPEPRAASGTHRRAPRVAPRCWALSSDRCV